MSRVSTTLPVSPARAFQLLEDPRSLRTLVVGARKIRRFDPRWPEVGSEVHHSVGVFPFVLRDTTSVAECDQDRRLVLKASIQMLGTFSVDFRLAPHPQGSTLVVEEHPVAGPFTLPLVKSVIDVAVTLRNTELCRRFSRLVERREHVAAQASRG